MSDNRHNIFSSALKRISNFGMKYDDMVIRNQKGIGINEDPNIKSFDINMFLSQRAIANTLDKKAIPYLDMKYVDKKRILREYSIKDEIRDFISRVTDEIIVYNEESEFCELRQLPMEYPDEVKNKLQEVFEKIYYAHKFKDGKTAWDMVKDFLIDGAVAYEILYDDRKKNIIGFARLAPETLIPGYEVGIGHIWIQYPEDPSRRVIFLDSEIIYMSYSTQGEFSETSYVEGLIKPYNQLKIMEQTRIMFNILNASIYQQFSIPTASLSKKQAEEAIGMTMGAYSENMEWDDTLGVMTLNGNKNLKFHKQIWLAEGASGKPSMEIISPSGHDLNDETMLSYFYKALKRASKIPVTRFDGDSGGGTLFGDASEMTRDEITFSNFTLRLKAELKETILKPIKLQMLIEFPEYLGDERFLNSINIIFNSNQLFEEWRDIQNMNKRAEAVNSMLSIQNGDKPYFHVEFAMKKYFKLTQEEKEENEGYWLRDLNNDMDVDMEGDDVGSFDNMEGDDMGTSNTESPNPEEPTDGMDDADFDF